MSDKTDKWRFRLVDTFLGDKEEKNTFYLPA